MLPTVVDSRGEAIAADERPPARINPTPAGRYKLIVIGSGETARRAALEAAASRAKVALVESPGPDRAQSDVVRESLIRAARVAHQLSHAAEHGFVGSIHGQWDLSLVLEQARNPSPPNALDVDDEQLASLGIDVFHGAARFTSEKTLEVEDATLKFRRALVATGSRPTVPRIPGLAVTGFLARDNLHTLCELPRRLFVVGAGSWGCELAQAFRRLGSEVHLINDRPCLLPQEDQPVQALLADRFAAEGIRLHLGWGVMHAQRLGSAKALLIGRGPQRQELIGDEILVTAGNSPNIESLDLAAAGVASNAQGILVDDTSRTTNARVFATGDCSSAEAFPRVTFTDPEVAHVGLTASVAEKRGTAIDTYHVNLSAANQAARTEASTGFVAVHTNYRNGQVIGATLVHPQASALIGEFARLIQEKRTPAALERTTIYCKNIAAAFQRIAFEYECRRRDTPGGNSFKRWLTGWR